ncbi:MAG: hypothetical protein ACXACU_06095, partial [Candidatus Hodarchaeales archaeon]
MKILSPIIIVMCIFISQSVLPEISPSNQNTIQTNNVPNETQSSTSYQSLVEIEYGRSTETEISKSLLEISESNSLSSDTTDYWLIIENEIENSDERVSTTYIEVAQKFEIIEEFANITEIKLYIQYVDFAKDGDYPRGSVSIFTDNNGEPGTQLGTTTLEEGFSSLDLGISIGPTWVTYTFSVPIEVNQDHYWLVLSDTTNQGTGYWVWYTQDDQTNGDSGDWAAKGTHDGNWVLNPFPPGDLASEVRIQPVVAPEPEPEPEP